MRATVQYTRAVVYYMFEKQKKLTVFYGTAVFFAIGLVYVGFKPEAFAAYQTFCTSISALAVGFFAAHATQKHSEVKYQNGNVMLSVEENKDANNQGSSK